MRAPLVAGRGWMDTGGSERPEPRGERAPGGGGGGALAWDGAPAAR